MSTLSACFITAMLSGSSMYLLAWRIHRKPLTREEMRDYMERYVHREEAELAERRLQAQLYNARRRAVPHPDAGAPVRITRVHVARKGRGEREE
ncbi:hypothetical protein PBI_THOTH_54 [Mycobacterium phage Thoth]|uniref:Uncharacterized protein n=12 Tax=Plotvirus TaxID=2169613 RepID=B5U420_9CAUD|nr:gp54 [Mycobacterium phage Troll4]YP_002241948.1 gp55 [Mycobacterium phage Gumball]YP_655247.1 gp51 [Mycobacterium phage PBI1]ACD49638.1 hypothetical protein Adjutor_53 [Mycobacterium phage Adjutor]ACI06341.1 hypothetical protein BUTTERSCOTCH_53 [Mycobacterium phage Butterscotch]AEK10264.1 hypothetical protein PBI_SIRHARLEY_55 [Mycobacterium phage SirHarley]AER49806.1 hypothetical protein NOVA_53 [Mycobacterium phage Nova]AVP43150.1 hypothetical protein PBI_BIGMAMA_52 [Mycobacterium phage 